VSLPLRAVLPPKPIAMAFLTVAAAAGAMSTLRPARLPRPAQRAADAISLSAVVLHPVQAVLIGRLLRTRKVTATGRRKAQLGALLFGIFSTVPAMLAARRAGRAG
jgi:hypothetical protein